MLGIACALLCAYASLGLAFASPANAASKAPIPDFSNYVVDNANVLNDADEQSINADLKAYQERTTNQIAMLLVKTTDPQSIENYAVDVGRKWGVGEKRKDNGVLVILAMNDRKGRIEVGYGLQGDLTDVDARDILETQIFPRLKQNNVSGAVRAGEEAIRAKLGDTGVTAPPAVKPTANQTSLNMLWQLLPIVFIALMVLLTAIKRGGKGSSNDGFWPGVILGGMTGWGAGSSWGSGSGWGSDGGFGGFGGGGGGSFGGGGASGDW